MKLLSWEIIINFILLPNNMSMTNPYKIDLDLEATQEHRKLFNLATKGLGDEDKFDLSLKKRKKIMMRIHNHPIAREVV